MPAPLFTFKVYPDHCAPKQKNCRRRFFLVKVFATVAQARADARRHDCLTDEPRSFWKWCGLAHAHTRLLVGPRGGTTRSSERGILWVALRGRRGYHLGAETVSHEMTHFACRIATEDGYMVGRLRRKGHRDVDVPMTVEERFCYTQGRLVRQFWDEFYRQRAGRRLRAAWARSH